MSATLSVDLPIYKFISNNKITNNYSQMMGSWDTAIEGPPHFKGEKYKLLVSEDQADLTMTCGDRVWNVRQDIICPKSGFFRAACKEGFKVNSHTS